jgi:hypothetical protein
METRRLATALVATLIVFVVPGGKLIIIASEHLSPAVTDSWWWSIVAVHQAWVTLIASILLVTCMIKENGFARWLPQIAAQLHLDSIVSMPEGRL